MAILLLQIAIKELYPSILFFMKYSFYYLVFLGTLIAFTAAAPKLKVTKISETVSVSIPSDFIIMPDDAIAAKYPAPRKPLGAFTSPNGQVDFIVSERLSTFKKEDLPMLKQFYRSAITNKYSKVDFIKEEVRQVDKQDFISFEFTSTVVDEERRTNKLAPIRRYTLIQYTIVKDKLLIFTFNAPIDLQQLWQPTARKMMQLIKLS